MRTFLSLVAVVGCAVSLGAQDQPDFLYTSTNGLRIEQDGPDFWVTFSDGQRVKLPVATSDDPEEAENPPHEFYATPSEEWIWAAHHVGSCMQGSELYHRAGPSKIDKVEGFNHRVWANAVKFGLFVKNFSEGGCNMIEFDAWSFDSARLSFRLRGGDDKREVKARRIYFNIRTQTFELTDYLRKLNKTTSEMLGCAEPVDPLPAEAELKKRLDSLDQKLNAKYAEVLTKAPKERVSVVRERQRDWLKERDAGEKLYVSFFPAAEKPRRHLQFLADVTAVRIEMPVDQWE